MLSKVKDFFLQNALTDLPLSAQELEFLNSHTLVLGYEPAYVPSSIASTQLSGWQVCDTLMILILFSHPVEGRLTCCRRTKIDWHD